MNAYKCGSRLAALLLCLAIPNLAVADTGGNNTNCDSDTGPEGYTLTAVVVLSALAIYAGGTYTLYKVTKSSSEDEEEKAARELSRYLRKNHGSVTRDVLASRGLFWETWQAGSGMTPLEAARLHHYFNGSEEQSAMLDALNSKLSVVEARLFAAAMLNAAHTALGPQRFEKIIEVALLQRQATVPQRG